MNIIGKRFALITWGKDRNGEGPSPLDAVFRICPRGVVEVALGS
jgi:hypothetical protein